MCVLYSFPYPVDRSGVAGTAWQQLSQLALHGDAAPLYHGTVVKPLPPSVEAHKNWVLETGRFIHHTLGDIVALQYQVKRLATDREEYTGVRNAGLAQRPRLSWDHAGDVLVAAYRRTVESELVSPWAAAI